MTHTKEPWRLRGAAISSPKPSATIAHAVQGSILGPDGARGIGKRESEANARRIVDCVNALTGIENPAAFVDAARGTMEALALCAKNVDWMPYPHCVEVGEAIETAYEAFRAQLGEAGK